MTELERRSRLTTAATNPANKDQITDIKRPWDQDESALVNTKINAKTSRNSEQTNNNHSGNLISVRFAAKSNSRCPIPDIF